jgi:hypothetical protein
MCCSITIIKIEVDRCKIEKDFFDGAWSYD